MATNLEIDNELIQEALKLEKKGARFERPYFNAIANLLQTSPRTKRPSSM